MLRNNSPIVAFEKWKREDNRKKVKPMFLERI